MNLRINNFFNPIHIRSQSCIQIRQTYIRCQAVPLLKVHAKYKRNLMVVDAHHFLYGHTQSWAYIVRGTHNIIVQTDGVVLPKVVVVFLTVSIVGIMLGEYHIRFC
jgi:hypothetical protein